MKLIDLVQINQRAVAMLGRIARGPAELIRSTLQPTPEDYEAVFVGDAAKRAAEGYAALWASPIGPLSKPVHAEVRVLAQLSQKIATSSDFPGAYRRIAPLLAPDYVWCVFKFFGAAGTNELSYDGLVAIGDRWAWFPKPWRVFPSAAALA